MRAAIAAFNAADIEGTIRGLAADVVIYPIEGWPDEQVYHGHDGARRIFAVWWEFFESTHVAIERILDVDESVVVLAVQTGVQQGVTVEQHIGSIVKFRGELAERIDYFLTWEKALATAGIAT